MKIKKIDINSFRVYEGLEEFNFICQGNKIADLVVIYGPNGFGKTSFTDAVEWAFTSQISRISKNQKLKSTMDLDKKNAKEFLYILKNRRSLEEQGTMEITSNSGEKVTIKTKKLDNRMKADYDYKDLGKNRVVVGKEGFLSRISPMQFRMNNLITSDAINSFLQFDDPEERYRVLARFWDEKGDTELYEKISNLTDMLYKRKYKLQEQIKDKNNRLEKILKNSIDTKELNILISEFNKYSQVTFKIYEENENDFNDLKDYYIIISEEMDKEKTELLEIEDNINYLDSNYKTYKEKIGENANLRKQKKNNDKILNVFDYVNKIGNHLKVSNDKLNSKQYYLRKLLKVLYHNRDFKTILINNQILDKQIKIYLDEKEIILNKSRDLIKSQEENNKQFNLLIKNKNQLENYIITVNKKLEIFKLDNVRLKYINKVKMEFVNKVERYKEKISFYENKNSKLEKYQVLTLENIYTVDLLTIPKNICLKNLYMKVIQTLNQYKQLKNNLNFLTKEKNNIQQITKRNEKIIELGLIIIETSKSSNCPLCGTEFNDLTDLVDEIKGNSCFKEELINKSRQIQELDVELDEKSKEIENCLEEFKEILNKLINSNNEIITKLSSNKQKVENNIRNLNNRLKEIAISHNQTKNIVTEIEKVLEMNFDVTLPSQIIIKLKNRFNVLENKIKAKQNIIDNINFSVEKNKQILIQSDNEIEILKNSKDRNLNTDCYKIVSDILKELNLEFDKSQLINNIVNINYEIELVKKSIDELNKKIITNKLILEKNDKGTLLKYNYELDGKVKENMQYIENYEIKYFNIISQMNNIIDIKKIGEKKKELLSKKNNLKNKRIYLSKISSYIELVNVNSEKILVQQELSELNVKIKNIDEKLKKFEAIRSRVEVFLSQKIQRAFNLDTINFIYKRIDPHPEFNEIKFVPDFRGKNPKMYIHALNEKEELSPVLYFSSAQVSILSLSIFLAKALLENTYLDTIFMDDPVQHLDSINVLSFIDLIRTIITDNKIKKQIVITTNNDMFYRLLKMKLDNDYYDSKFIELKSYGIVN